MIQFEGGSRPHTSREDVKNGDMDKKADKRLGVLLRMECRDVNELQ